jgi:hypothetical protein
VARVRSEFEGVFGVPLTRVGSVEQGEGVWWGAVGAERAQGGGFQHFGGG